MVRHFLQAGIVVVVVYSGSGWRRLKIFFFSVIEIKTRNQKWWNDAVECDV